MSRKLKNARPGILMVPDAGLRLSPGEVVEVMGLTRGTEAALKRGFLVKVEAAKSAAPLFEDQEADAPGADEKGDEEDMDFTSLSATEAISRVGEENDLAKLKAGLEKEKRRKVLDALKKRLAEVEGGSE